MQPESITYSVVINDLEQIIRGAIRSALLDLNISPEPRYKLAYSMPEACDMLSISPGLLKDLISDGKLKSKKIGSRRIIAHNAIIEFLAAD